MMTLSTVTTEPLTREQWDDISRRLREPFDPKEVDFRAQGRPNEQTGKAQVVAYVDARAVQDRLDDVVGAGNWAFDWQPVITEKGEVMVAKGVITIYGVSKADAGSASNFEQSLGAVSHCFKRAAVQWGIGRYLYSLPAVWVPVEKGGRIPEATLRELRARLPRPGHAQQQPAQQPQPADQQRQQPPDQASQPLVKPRQNDPVPADEQKALAAFMRAKRLADMTRATRFLAAHLDRPDSTDYTALATAISAGTSDLKRHEHATLVKALYALPDGATGTTQTARSEHTTPDLATLPAGAMN